MQPLLRHPPAFQMELRADFIWRCLHMLLYGLASVALGLSCWAHQLISLAPLILCLPLAFGVLAPLAWRHGRSEAHQLIWDGQAWAVRLSPALHLDASPCTVRVLLDLGGWMLLELRLPDTGKGPARRMRVHLALSRRSYPNQWHGLRSTLYGYAG
ncbi:MAG: hypothetical protein JO370_16580 [Paucibacter sp.]|nr:hypothetical protein [Roseateles sp.]